MRLPKYILATAGAALVAAPIAAQSAPVVLDRASAPVTDESGLVGGIGPAFIIIALAAAGAAILLLTDDDEDTPISA